MKELFKQVRTNSQLFADGLSSTAITRLCREGQLLRLARNAYVETALWRQWDKKTRLLAQQVSFIKTHENYILSHTSAALWWEAPLLSLPEKVWVSHPSPQVRSRPGVRVSAGRPAACAGASFHQGAWVTSPVQTAVDCARSLPLPDALCIMDFFLHRQLVSPEEVKQAVEASSGRGSRRALRVLELMSGLAESPAETLARYQIRQAGFLPPQEQALIRAGWATYRVDFFWPQQGVILEVDGRIKYEGGFGRPSQVIQDEKRRQRELEKLGYRVVRVMWEDVFSFPENLQALLVQAGVPRVGSARTARAGK